MKRRLFTVAAGILVLAANLLLWLPAAIAAPTIPPKPTQDIFVQDYAGVLSEATRQHILQASEALSQGTGAQVAVLTIDSLDGASLEEYSLAVLRGWGIGSKENNDGVLLLAVIGDRQLRVEVGYGLEGAIPDGKAGRIMDEAILPFFKTGDYDGGIKAGYDAILTAVAQEKGFSMEGLLDPADVYQPAPELPEAELEPSWFSTLPGWLQKLLIGVGIVLVIIFFIFDNLVLGGFFTRLLFIILSLFGRGGRGGGGGGSGFGGGSGGGGGASRSW